jgi:uncharacterized pyridoxal phosphate-dependent enzyme
MGIYDEVGAKRVINASFPVTVLGGSRLTKEMLDAIVEANESYVDFWDFMGKAGKFIAKITGAEAACVTPGAFSALSLSTVACMAGKDPEKIKRLPDTSGMKNEIVIQRCLRSQIYDRSMTVFGGKYVFAGNESVCSPKELEAAINEKTAAIHYLASERTREGVVPLEEVIRIGKRHGVPIIVDAAGQTYPTDGLKKFVAMGADLVCYSSKYFGGPNAAGFVQGRKELVETVALHTFLGIETQARTIGAYSIGRGYKMDRQTVAAMLFALKRWMTMDHEKERIQPAIRRRDYILKELADLSKVKMSAYPENFVSGHVLGVQLTFENEKAAEETVRKLREGNPAIWIRGNIINTLFLKDGEEKIVAKRLKEILS